MELTEWAVTGDPMIVDSGNVQFRVRNIGRTTHELVVIKTGPGDTELPIAASGFAEERGEGIEVVDRTKEIQAGKSLQFMTGLGAGEYLLICNLVTESPGEKRFHYVLGMRRSMTVR